MHRVLAHAIDESRVVLDPGEAHHLVHVLRLREDATFEALTVEGKRFVCTLFREGSQWFGRIMSAVTLPCESPLHLILAQALVKRDKFEWIVQKAVELGVSEILPVISHRTEVRLDEARRDRKLERWNRILVEAVKQCGRTVIPMILEPLTLAEALRSRAEAAHLVFDEEGNDNLRQWIQSNPPPHRLVTYVGPEGGWDNQDRALFAAGSIPRVKLGNRTLRAETAAVTAISILQYEWGDLCDVAKRL